jgi:hypothetical protein
MINWIRLVPYAAGLAVFLIFTGVIHHRGVLIGRAQIQAKFDKFVDAQEALTIQAQKEADAKEAAAKKANDAILADYTARLGTSTAYSHELARRLRDALARPSGSPVSEGEGGPGTPGAGPSPSATGIGERIADALAECRDNANQLDSLLFELTPQL